MVERGNQTRFPGSQGSSGMPTRIPEPDALFVGTSTLENAGYRSLSGDSAESLNRACSEDRLEPGLIHYMLVCLPFNRIYTHGDCGIVLKAGQAVNKSFGPEVEQLEDEKVTTIIGQFPWWQDQIKEQTERLAKSQTSPAKKKYSPEHLLIASIDGDFDAEVLDRLITDCKQKNPRFNAYLMAGEPLPQNLVKKHKIKKLKITWDQYLDTPDFYRYYGERLENQYSELRHFPQLIGFTGRKTELDALDKMTRENYVIQVDGGNGIGKSALLAHLAIQRNKKHARTAVWVTLDSPFVSKAEILLNLGLQLNVIKSPRILEQESLEKFLPALERDIERALGEQDVLLVIDQLDALLKQGRDTFENKPLQELISRWVSGGLFGQQVLKKAHIALAADLRPKTKTKDFFKEFKSTVSRAVGGRDQKLMMRPLADAERKKLFQKWLGPVAQIENIGKSLDNAFALGGSNLKQLRLLALWLSSLKDFSRIDAQLQEIEKIDYRDREDELVKRIYKSLDEKKRTLLKMLQWIGKPLPRQVLCSSAGMIDVVDDLLKSGLLMEKKSNDTVGLTYRFPETRESHGRERGDNLSVETIMVPQIRAMRRIGLLTEKDSLCSSAYYSAGGTLCEKVGHWEEWNGAPVLNLSGLFPMAQHLLRKAKERSLSAEQREKMAHQSVQCCLNSISAGIDTAESHFVCAQAMNLAYSDSNEEEIREHYEKSIALRPRPDKYGSFAAFLYKRLKEFEKAEQCFLKARKLETKKRYLNIIGLHAQAEFYMNWKGHEEKAVEILNKVIGKKDRQNQSIALAARMFKKIGLKFTAASFYELSGDKQKSRELLKKAGAHMARDKNAPAKRKGRSEATGEARGFSFTEEEKNWLTGNKNEKRSWTGDGQWGGFAMMYTLYFFKEHLASAAEQGFSKEHEQEYRFLFNSFNSLYEMVDSATYEKEQTTTPDWDTEWFAREGNGLDLIAYYDNMLLANIKNPVCAAFLCQTFENHGWTNFADELRNALLQWTGTDKDKWKPFMTKQSVDLLAPEGKKEFQDFLEQLKKKDESGSRGTTPITREAITGYINSYGDAWQSMSSHFPWSQLAETEAIWSLGRLSGLIGRLKNILMAVLQQETGAVDGLKAFIEEIAVPVALMDRLNQYVQQQN
jgi:hypothetical protein